MTLWFILAFLTLAAMAAMAWPLVATGPAPANRAGYDLAVFRDQLAELERDATRGLIGAAEAEAARNEIARRMLAAKPGPAAAPARGNPWVALVGLALMPAVAAGAYGFVGRPGLPDVPRQQRLDRALEAQDMPALIAKIEDHLAANPDDLEGWAVLAPSYRKLERYGDAAEAYANLLRLAKPQADYFASYAEMLAFANHGLLTAEASRALREALKLDPKHPKARYFTGLGLKQEGQTAAALAMWRDLLADSPQEAPWRAELQAEIASGETPSPSAEQLAAAETMSDEDRQRMIRGMVDGLEAKLKENAADVEGWRRLMRARMALGEPDKAKAAYVAARDAFKGKPEVLASFEGLARDLGVE